MSHVFRLPFITEDPNDLRRTLYVTKMAWGPRGEIHFQGRPVGSRGRPSTWRATEWDFANLLLVMTTGYGGQLYLPGERDIWTELAAKIEEKGRRR